MYGFFLFFFCENESSFCSAKNLFLQKVLAYISVRNFKETLTLLVFELGQIPGALTVDYFGPTVKILNIGTCMSEQTV